jgi:hypothetical protein
MSTDRDVTRIVRSWLEQGATALPDRVLDTVLDQLPATPQRRASWPARRLREMNPPIRIAIAAAAVAAVAVVAIRLQPPDGIGALPTPPPTASPTASERLTSAPSLAPGPTALPLGGSLAARTYVIGDPFQLQVSLDVTEGWSVWGAVSSAGAGIYKDSPDPPAGKAIVVTIVDEVYVDPCDRTKGTTDPGPTPNDLATALASQPATQASAISDVTLAGYSGKYVEYTFDSRGEPGCSRLVRWAMSVGPREAISDEHDKVWILDVDGVRLVIDAASFSGASPADHADMQAIVESIQIEQGAARGSATPPRSSPSIQP